MKPPDESEMTVSEAREFLREQAVGEGAECPVCTQFTKVYRRKIHASMARALITIYRESTKTPGWLEIVNILSHKELADAPKLRYWGLIEEDNATRADGSRRTGFWRITLEGAAFAKNAITVPKYARIFNSRCLSFEGPEVNIIDCLTDKFHYGDLMKGI